jgi:hypothetical protein
MFKTRPLLNPEVPRVLRVDALEAWALAHVDESLVACLVVVDIAACTLTYHP